LQISQAINETWCEFITIDVKLKCSAELSQALNWHCKHGVQKSTMKLLNEEFNHFRGLFPLKVFITGPPCSGKTHFANRLNELYGIPHIKIENIIAMGRAIKGGYGDVVQSKIEELKDQAEADYEKSRKKKDPDFDRSTCNPRLPDEVVHELVKI